MFCTAPMLAALPFMHPGALLAGLLLASIPIIIHLLNRRRFKIVRWAAMEYLLQALRKNRRRLRFEQWLLLATRCSLLFLLGLALARPLGCTDNAVAAWAGQQTGLHVFILDNSLSMAYEADRPGAKTHLEQARKQAKQIIDKLAPGGEAVVIISAAAPASAIIAKPTFDLDQAKAAIDRLEQRYTATDIAGALQLAVQVAQEESVKQPRRLLYLFTDGTRSAWEGPRAEAIRQAAVQVPKLYRPPILCNVGKLDQWNYGILEVKAASNLVTNKFANEFTAAIRGYGKCPEARLQWKWDKEQVDVSSALTPAPDTRPQTLSKLKLEGKPGGPHVLASALLNGDKLKADDARWRTVDVASELKILIVEGEPGVGVLGGSGAFLELALAPPKDAGPGPTGRTDSYIAPDRCFDMELGNRPLADYRAILLTNVDSLPLTIADHLQQFVKQGGTLMMFMGEKVNLELYNKVFLPRSLTPGPLVTRKTDNEAGFHFDFNPNGVIHPLLGIFRGQEKSGLNTARVYTYVQLVLPPDSKAERVLNYKATDKGADPAITVHNLEKGRVVFISTTANADWTSFPAKPAYPPLMHELLAGSVNIGDRWMNLSVGDALEIPPGLKLEGPPALHDPSEKKEIPLERVQVAGGQLSYRSKPLDKPGVYALTTGKARYPISVNVSSEETDVRVLTNDKLRKALGDIELQAYMDAVPALALSSQDSHDYGWPIMAVLLALVGAEAFMAMYFGHYRRPAAPKGAASEPAPAATSRT